MRTLTPDGPVFSASSFPGRWISATTSAGCVTEAPTHQPADQACQPGSPSFVELTALLILTFGQSFHFRWTPYRRRTVCHVPVRQLKNLRFVTRSSVTQISPAYQRIAAGTSVMSSQTPSEQTSSTVNAAQRHTDKTGGGETGVNSPVCRFRKFAADIDNILARGNNRFHPDPDCNLPFVTGIQLRH